MENISQTIANALINNYQIDNWWPHESKFEIMMGAILVQRTKWENVEIALKNLNIDSLLNPKAISEAPIDEIEMRIRPSGFYRVKSKRLKNLSNLLIERFDGDEKNLFKLGLEEAKKLLLSIDGVGYETAETILLYAGNYPIFIVDAYAKRIFSRIGIFDGLKDKDIQNHFKGIYGLNPSPYKHIHSTIVQHCQNVCKKKPECSKCPIMKYCKKCEI